MTERPEERGPRDLEVASFSVQATRGLIRDQSMRRKFMALLLALAALQVIMGATLLHGLLVVRPLLFLLYWGACAWLTATALLLALFDLLSLRAARRADRRRLREEISSRDPS